MSSPISGDIVNIKDVMLKRIKRQAQAEARHLAGEFARAASEEKEAILAELEYEKWLAEVCFDALPEAMQEPS